MKKKKYRRVSSSKIRIILSAMKRCKTERTCCKVNVYKPIPLYRFNFDNYYDMTRDKKIYYFITNENELKIKILSRRRIKHMPTDNQCISEAKNSTSPTTLTPRPRCFIHVVNGEL